MDKIVGYDLNNKINNTDNYKKIDKYHNNHPNDFINQLNKISDGVITLNKNFKTISDGDTSYLEFPGIKNANFQICDRIAFVLKNNIKEVNCKYYHKDNSCYFICKKN